jgi:hypothetical protein
MLPFDPELLAAFANMAKPNQLKNGVPARDQGMDSALNDKAGIGCRITPYKEITSIAEQVGNEDKP